MATVKVDASNFQTEVLESNVPVVVDFWAEWCGPCKMIAPSLEEISTELAIPTLAMFKAGSVADIKVGALPKTALSTWISGAA